MKRTLTILGCLFLGLQSIFAIDGRVYDECNDILKTTWFGNTKVIWGDNSTWSSRQGDVYRYALDDKNNWGYMVYQLPEGASVTKMIVDFYSPTGLKPTLAVKDQAGNETKYIQGWDNGMPTETSLGANIYRYELPQTLIPGGCVQSCVYLDGNSDVEIMRVITEYGNGYTEPDVNATADFSRLQKVLAKAAAGDNITLAVIGGSMTAGANSEPFNPAFPNCYGARMKDYIETKYGVQVDFINAGIGSTNSFFGCIRAEDHILKYNPDLVIMEYAANDNGDEESLICYEGLMRKILKAPGRPALLATMMCTQAGIGQGEVQIPVAQHYNVPVINYGATIKNEIVAAQKTWSDYYAISTNPNGDGVHPNTAGHQKVADIFAGICESVTPDAGKTISSVLPAPKYNSNMEDAFFVNETNAKVTKTGEWTDGGSIWNFNTGKGWRAAEANSELIFDFTGSVAAVTYWKRPAGEGFGRAEVWVDDNSPVIIDGSNGEHIWQQILTGFDNGSHQLHIKLIDNKPFEVICVAFSGDRDFFNKSNLSISSDANSGTEFCFVNDAVELMLKGMGFTSAYTADGYLCFNNQNSYVSVEPGTGKLIKSDELNDNSKFLYVDKGTGFALRSVCNGKYVTVKKEGYTMPLVADAADVTPNELFTTSDFVDGPITSVDDNIRDNTIIYKVGDSICIKNAENKKLTVISIDGKILYAAKVIDNDNISIKLNKGIHIIQLNNDTYKIII